MLTVKTGTLFAQNQGYISAYTGALQSFIQACQQACASLRFIVYLYYSTTQDKITWGTSAPTLLDQLDLPNMCQWTVTSLIISFFSDKSSEPVLTQGIDLQAQKEPVDWILLTSLKNVMIQYGLNR